MIRNRRARLFASALVLSVAGTAATIVTTATPAAAAPHGANPTPVQIGWTDSSTPRQAYPWTEGVHMPLGTWTTEDGTSHTSRIYATFDLARFQGKTVYGGQLGIRENSAADCTKRAIEVWRTKAVEAPTTWRSAPAPLAKLDEILTPEFCPTANIAFDVGAAVLDAVARKQRLITFELRVPAEHEADPAYGRRLNWFSSVRLSVEYNSTPTIDNNHLYNGGFACSDLKPYPRLGFFGDRLQALGGDADTVDSFEQLTAEFAIWPKSDTTARTEFNTSSGIDGRVWTGIVPEGSLVDGEAYIWQARYTDGVASSPWSRKCFFQYDITAPSAAPTVTSANYPPGGAGPIGERPVFTFSGNRDRDVAGFEWAWGDLGAPVCELNSGDVGQMVCPDPFAGPNAVRVSPGGAATVTIDPPPEGFGQLNVRSIDLAGNRSPVTLYETSARPSEPTVVLDGGTPEWNQWVRLKVTPHAGLTGVYQYSYRFGFGEEQVVSADENGVAYIDVFLDDPTGTSVHVRSRSANGFVSGEATWAVSFFPWPGVTSADYPSTGEPSGGVGIEGTFTFSPIPGWTDTAGYRYSLDNFVTTHEVAAGSDGRATVTLAPATSGWNSLAVYALRPDGTQSGNGNWYSFNVAG